MFDVKFLRRSLQSRGRYINEQLEASKRLLRTKDRGEISSEQFSDYCEQAISLKEQISVKIGIYTNYFHDLHEQVVPLCLGNSTEEERHEDEYNLWADLKESCDDVIAQLTSFISVMKFRIEMEYTLAQSDTERKVPVQPANAVDKLISEISNMGLLDQQPERPLVDSSVRKTLKFSPAQEVVVGDVEGGVFEDSLLRDGVGTTSTAPTLYATTPAGDVIAPTKIPPLPVTISHSRTIVNPRTVETPAMKIGAPLMSSTRYTQTNGSENRSPVVSSDINDWLVPLESVHVSEEKFTTPLTGGVDKSWLAPIPSNIAQPVIPSNITQPVIPSNITQPVIPSIIAPPTKIENIHTTSVLPPGSKTVSWLLPQSSETSENKEKVHDESSKSKVENHENSKEKDVSKVTSDAKLLARISIPKFKGDKRQYEGWKAAFTSLVDQTDLSIQHKVLRLHETLGDDPRNFIVDLGYSEKAYEAALKRLDKKYGGNKRRVRTRIDDLKNFKPVRENNESDLTRLAETLDVLIVNLSEAGDDSELQSISLYLMVQEKLTKNLLRQYAQWISEHKLDEGLESLREFVDNQAEYLTLAGEALKGTSKDKGKNQQAFVTTEQSSTRSDSSCAHCKKRHPIWFCRGFKALPVDERWKRAKELKLCFLCLGGHVLGSCDKLKQPCGVDGCQKMHNRLLHGSSGKPANTPKPEGASQKKSSGASQNKPSGASGGNDANNTELKSPYSDARQNSGGASSHVTVTLSSGRCDSEEISLRTVPCFVVNGERIMRIHTILDDCSTTSYINSDVAAELGLVCDTEDISVGVLNGKRSECSSGQVTFEIQSLDGRVKKSISAFLMDNVTGQLQVKDWNKIKSQHSHLKNIPFPKINKSKRKIDMMIGADNCDLIYSIKEVVGEPGEPIARLTPLGWTCIGPTHGSQGKNTHFSFMTVQADPEESQIAQVLRKCWEIEEPQGSHPQKTIDAEVMEKVEKSITYDENTCRYSVSIPWKQELTDLPDTLKMAKRRLLDTEKNLNKREGLRAAYGDIFKKYEQKGYIRRVPENEKVPAQVMYLAHFPVIKLQRLTTKVRICFDSSQKCGGISLNDLIHPGPKLQNDIDQVLIHMRKHVIVLMADVSEMYYQIELKPEDRPFFRFLWREAEDEPPAVYEFQRVFFGMNAAPFLAHLVSQHHARVNKELLPLAAKTVMEHTYMDDNLDSVSSVTQGVQLYKELCTFWSTCGMKPHKWVSNSKELLQEIPSADIIPTFDLDRDEMPGTKTLGSLWKPKEDQITFESTEVDNVESITKRSFLHHTMSLFDPYGILSPYTIQAKILFQEMWARGLTWDEEIPMELRNQVMKWYSELKHVPDITVNRCLRKDENVVGTQLHMFCDASTEAYGASVYTRHTYSDGDITCRLARAKGKVCPLRAVSVPRLELMSALEGVKLMVKVAAALEVPPAEWFMWTDSMDVLHWVRGRSRQYKPFVSHRVGEIQHYTEPEQWRHVPTKLNPSDIISRGKSVSQLKDDELWWGGPAFLLLDEEEWPKTTLNDGHQKKEMRKTETFSSIIDPIKAFDRLDPKNYSSWTRMCRVMAWIYRFLHNAQIHEKKDRDTGPLRPDEITMAENKYLVTCQHEAFATEINKLRKEKTVSGTLSSLNPFIDDEGLLRNHGRLAYADTLPWETRYPIILPANHSLTELIIRDAHEQLQHGGTNHILQFLSATYWIITPREEIRKWEKKCNMCKRRKQKPAVQIMSPLPRCRSAKSLKSFTLVSLDFAGPIQTKQGRGKARLNRYVCLFTDLEIRAVHLEVAYALTTDSFLMSLSRMTDHRGVMTDIWCDNGSNFLGAQNELEALENQRKVMEKTAHKKITWHFQPPAAPHFSGVHERMVQSAKRAIYAILNSAEITDEELHTAVTGAMALINSRPLTYQSANPDDIVPLTPNHFLTGQMGGNFAPTEVVDSTDYSPKKRWRRMQEINRHFWERWMKEWLPTLQGRKKWQKRQENLKVGDVVIVVSPDTPRGSWPLGRVTQTFPGEDGNVRVVEVKVKGKLLRRPVAKLCLLQSN